MAQGIQSSEYTKTYTTFSGCDIVATFNNKVIGELQAITYSVSREKAPVYTMGSAEPRSFSRGKRGIAGTLVFTVFDRDALIGALKDESGKQVHRIYGQSGTLNTEDSALTIDEWDRVMTETLTTSSDIGASARAKEIAENMAQHREANYADEIPPFDITISFANEYGQRAHLTIFAAEILNEGTGFSIDSVTTEKACTFVARRVGYLESAGSAGENDSTPEMLNKTIGKA